MIIHYKVKRMDFHGVCGQHIDFEYHDWALLNEFDLHNFMQETNSTICETCSLLSLTMKVVEQLL